MSAPTSSHKWLRRVSDYHSGGVSDAEAAAVEAHLPTCQECQEALAMYHRFYTLLGSPLRLGPPTVRFDEETLMIYDTISDNADTAPTSAKFRPPRPPRRSRALAGIAAIVAATLVVAGFLAVYAGNLTRPANDPTATPRTPQPTATVTFVPTATPGADSTPQASAFVCANPPGSNLTYAYWRGDKRTYIVTGCSAPQMVPVPAYSFLLAWSPANRYLALETNAQNDTYPLVIYDTSNRQTITTKFVGGYPSEANYGTVIRKFIGWVDDNTFLGAVQPVVSGLSDGPLGASTIVKVDVASQRETTVGTVAWFADTKMIAPGYLFYAGYQSKSEGQAYLHRLDLNTGADTRLVPIGEYGNGGCQGTIFCNWTAPWDVSADGTHVIYHNPGPNSFPSDINIVRDTPLIYADINGANPSKPFSNRLAYGLTLPLFSPDGSYILALGLGDAPDPNGDAHMGLARIGGSVTILEGGFYAWRGDSKAFVLIKNDAEQPLLYDIASRTTTPLEQGTTVYLWGN